MTNVLLVEEDTDLAKVISAALTASGHEVRTAGSLDAALKAIAEAWPDIVTLDLDLNGRNAPYIIDAVRRQDLTASFLFMSEASPQRAFDSRETDDWLSKPFDVEVLKQKVDRLAESRLTARGVDREPKDCP